MKILAILTLASAAVLPVQAATNIGVSIGINAPGQYGRIDIDNYRRPMPMMQPPVVYAPSPVAQYQRPIYLYVPRAHQANWGRYCGGYSACGQPVYFVPEAYVRDEYRREHDPRNARKADQQRERIHPGPGYARGHDRRQDRGQNLGHDRGPNRGQDRKHGPRGD